MDGRNEIRKSLRTLLDFEVYNAEKLRDEEPKVVDAYTFKYKTLLAAVLVYLANFLLKKIVGWYFVDIYIITVPLLLATAWGTYRTVKSNKKQKEQVKEAREALSKHKKLIAEFDSVFKAEEYPDIYPWWQKYNRVEELNKSHYGRGHLYWYPVEKYRTDEEGDLRLKKYNTCDEGFLSGEKVEELLLNNSLFDVLYSDIKKDRKYKFASLYLEDFHYGSVYTVSEPVSRSEINSQMSEYGEKLDNQERLFNSVNGNGYYTDEERYSFGRMSSSEYIDSSALRGIREYNKSQKISNQTNNTVVEDNDWAWLFRVGMIVFDESEKFVKAVLLFNEPAEREHIEFGRMRSILEISEMGESTHYEEDRRSTIYQVALLDYEKPIDPLSSKPECFTDAEWGTWITCRD